MWTAYAQPPGVRRDRWVSTLRRLLIVLSLGLAWTPAAPARAATGGDEGIVVSLDLCSDWLLTTLMRRADRVLLSPLSRRHPAPWMTGDWPIHDGSLEQILDHRPRLALVGEFNASLLRARLERLGVKTLVTRQPSTLDAIEEHLRLVQAALADAGIPTVIGSDIGHPANDPPQPLGPGRDRRAQRLLLLAPNGFGAGPQTFEADLIRAAGWRNYLDRPGHQSLDLERLVIDPPDAVIWAAPHAALANRFAQHRALARAMPAERWLHTDYWRWQCPGPWSFGLVRQLQP